MVGLPTCRGLVLTTISNREELQGRLFAQSTPRSLREPLRRKTRRRGGVAFCHKQRPSPVLRATSPASLCYVIGKIDFEWRGKLAFAAISDAAKKPRDQRGSRLTGRSHLPIYPLHAARRAPILRAALLLRYN